MKVEHKRFSFRVEARKAKYWILFSISAVLLVLDQWTKQAVHSSFRWGESIPIIDSFFSLTYVRNTGAAFGMLHKAPVWFREPFFITIPIVAFFVVLYFLFRLHDKNRLMAVAFSLILGGALGNLIDRVRFGYVIDFLDFYWGTYHWPAFNVADMGIVVGVGLVMINGFLQGDGALDAPPGRKKKA